MNNEFYKTVLANDKTRQRSTRNRLGFRLGLRLLNCQRPLRLLVPRHLLQGQRGILCPLAPARAAGVSARQRGLCLCLTVRRRIFVHF